MWYLVFTRERISGYLRYMFVCMCRLFCIYLDGKITFYKNVFLLARQQHVSTKLHRLFYIIGKLIDILCHSIHMKNLLLLNAEKNGDDPDCVRVKKNIF